MHKQIILASSSTSRFKILKNAGVVFVQKNPKVDENKIKLKIKQKYSNPQVFVKKLSFEKSLSISKLKKYKNNYVIGCDTIVYFDNKIFDKAKNMKEAYKKIEKLSGKQHKIISGTTICLGGRKIWQCSETSLISMRRLSDRDIKAYLRKTGDQILGSVGCYQIELHGPQIIKNIKGDFFNVMGLPLFKILSFLNESL